MLEKNGQADAIEITPAMIEAGVYAVQDMRFGQSLHDVVYEVYLAMFTEASARSSRPPLQQET